MSSFYVVIVRWVQTPVHPQLIDAVLGLYGDWLRITADSWYVRSSETPRNIAEHIARNLKSEDGVLVTEANLLNSWGSAPKFVWDWFMEHDDDRIPGMMYVDPAELLPPALAPKIEKKST